MDKIMWELIARINWAARSEQKRGFDSGKQFMLENFSQDTCQQIRKFVAEKRMELSIRVDEYENDHGVRCGDYGGDDSYGDMLHHVIGLGEVVYEMIMDNPSLLDRINYVESFSYCLPYDDDFKHDDSPELAEAKKVIRTLITTLAEDGQFGLDVVTDALEFLRKK